MNQSPLVDIQGLTVHRGDRHILQSLDWKIHRGEHWVILGPNGSGKTSLLSVLTGYLFPTTGIVSVLGETFGEYDWRDLRKQIGLVSSSLAQQISYDESALDAVCSGKDAIINSWRPTSPKDRAKARKLLKLVEGGNLEKSPWGILSQGERQRVLIARALMAQPEILILDEACAGLDPVAREHFLQFLSRFAAADNAPTLVFVTHHLEEITPLFSHVLMLKNGQMVYSGSIHQGLHSKNLSLTFGVPLNIKRSKNRFVLGFGYNE